LFLKMTLKRNPRLIEAAVSLHRHNRIYPNTYVLDIDTIRANVRLLVEAARKSKLTLYMMTKQIGRNPELAKIIAECGIEKAAAVDPWEALTLARAGIKLGNVGHLVQIPSGMIQKILTYRPEVVTVFSVEKAREISAAAGKLNIRQDLLLKVVGPKDIHYEGQAGGFTENALLSAAREIQALPNVNIVGVTSFPCFLYQPEDGVIRKTENADTVVLCAKMLEREAGVKISQINTPSANAVASFPLLHELGATHAEPGHAITGTTPLHSYRESEEIPALVYVSEVSHQLQDKAYVYGGGHYRRSQVAWAMVGNDFQTMQNHFFEVETIASDAIDYYGVLQAGNQKIRVGDTVIYAFRTQIFVTRSEVALVEGIQNGDPRITGIYDCWGKKLR
jgi:predicted amino acid racemase